MPLNHYESFHKSGKHEIACNNVHSARMNINNVNTVLALVYIYLIMVSGSTSKKILVQKEITA